MKMFWFMGVFALLFTACGEKDTYKESGHPPQEHQTSTTGVAPGARIDVEAPERPVTEQPAEGATTDPQSTNRQPRR